MCAFNILPCLDGEFPESSFCKNYLNYLMAFGVKRFYLMLK